MSRVIIETTSFFRRKKDMQEFVERLSYKPHFEIIKTGKLDSNNYYVKYRKT